MTDKAIANYDEMLAALAKKAVKTEKPSSSTISLKAGMIQYNSQPVPGNKLDCIIIASTHANLYYEGKYDPNNLASPVCYAYSEDPDEVEMVPHPKSSKPQSDKCATCPHNQWGSDPDGGRGKACKNTRRLALVPANVTPEDVGTAEVATMALPVMSTKNWGNYVNKLATLFGLPPLAFVTTVGTQPDAKSQFKVTFDDNGQIDRALLPGLMAKLESVKPMLEREYEANPEPSEEAPKKKGKF